jgi:AcrR family transcriptional regulator
MPRVVDFEQKKGEIAHKALYAFAFEGFHKTSLNAIARMCGIGRTTIYEYFHNKDEIFTYALDHSFDLMKLDFQSVLNTSGLGSLERLAAIIRVILMVFYEDRRILFLLLEHTMRILRENRELAGRFRERALEIQSLFAGLLAEGMERGEVRPVPVDRLALTLGMLVEAAILQISIGPGTPLEEVLAGIGELLKGLGR